MDVTNNVFRPILNLVVFRNDDDSYSTRFYIEKRRIYGDKTLGPAMPLDKRTLMSLVTEFSKEMESKIYLDRVIDNRIVYINQRPNREFLIWKYSLNQANLFFADGTNILSGLYSIPNLLFMISSYGTVSVYAYKGIKDNVTDGTELFQAPFLNTGSGGNVCMGDVTINIKQSISAIALMKKVENRFFASKFTHTSGKIVLGSVQYLFDHHLGAQNPFDEEILIPLKIKVKSLIDEKA
jgi:PRTRC genetic system protein B